MASFAYAYHPDTSQQPLMYATTPNPQLLCANENSFSQDACQFPQDESVSNAYWEAYAHLYDMSEDTDECLNF